MAWKVGFTHKAAKQVKKLPESIQDVLKALVLEIEIVGPIRGNWPNYSKLGKNEHHCHLTRRYVACWQVVDSEIRLVEIYYAGTREKAPY